MTKIIPTLRFSDPETHLFDSDRSHFLLTDTSEYVNESRGDRKFILYAEKNFMTKEIQERGQKLVISIQNSSKISEF